MKRFFILLGLVLTLTLPSSVASYSSGFQPDQLPPGTWSYGTCRSDINLLSWCGAECLTWLRKLDIVHPHVIIKHTANGTGKETIVLANGFNPSNSYSAGIHVLKVITYKLATDTYISIGSDLIDWIMNWLGIDESNHNLYHIIRHIIFNRIYPEPVTAKIYNELWKHEIPGGVFGCDIVEDELDANDWRLQGVLHRMSGTHGYKYHLRDFNSQHWAYWVVHDRHLPIPWGISI